MKVLITGSSGLIGQVLVDSLDDVLCFDFKTGQDIRKYDQVKSFVDQADFIVHLAGILPPKALMNKENTMNINLKGTQNLVDAIKACERKLPLIYTSSVSVYGYTQQLNRFIEPDDHVYESDYYTETKLLAEAYIKSNLKEYVILRLAGVLSAKTSYSLDLLKESFKMPPHAKAEFVLDLDVATAIQHAMVNFRNVRGKTLIIGGGHSMQIRTRELMVRMFNALGIEPPREECYEKDTNKYYLNWYNTHLSQSLLMYQNHSFDEYIEMMAQKKKVPKLFSKFVGRMIENISPYR